MLWLAAAHAERLPLHLFTSANGLASNSVNRIVRDSRGYLWFCTGEGLSRFDGSEFTTYRTDHGLPARSVLDLLETRNGEYFAATVKGVAHFLPRGVGRDKFETVRIVTDDLDRRAPALAQTQDGAIWCGTNTGLYRLAGTRPAWEFRRVELGPMPESWADAGVNALIPDADSGLWAGGNSGLWRISRDGTRTRWTDRHGLPSPIIVTLLEDNRGTRWAGTESGLCRLVTDPKPNALVAARCYTTRDGLPSNYVQRLLSGRDGALWAGTLNGAAHMVAGESFEAVTVKRGLSDNNIEAVAEDIERNIWLGSNDDGGAMRLVRQGAVMYNQNDGLDSANVVSIFEDQEGLVRAMTRSATRLVLHRFDGRGFVASGPPLPSGPNSLGRGVEQLAIEDGTGTWWVATGNGLLQVPRTGAPRTHLIHDPASNGANVFRVFEDSRGDIWWSVSSRGRNGLARWERKTGSVRMFTESDGLPSLRATRPTAFAEDRGGAVWFGMDLQGVMRFRQGKFEVFDSNSGGPSGTLRASYVDKAGRLWFGSGLGLWRVDQPEAARPVFQQIGMAEGLSSPSIRAIVEDNQGRIYAVSGSAVDRIDLQTGRVKHYTSDDGLPFGTLQTAHRDRQGQLWFGSTLGVARLRADEDAPAGPLPRAVVRGVRIRGTPAPISDLGETALDGLDLAPEESQVEFQFAAVNFKPGETTSFQYLLEGGGAAEWSAPSESKSVSFATLRPGKYRFLVRVAPHGPASSPEVASVLFRIRPPVWATWWFRLGMAILVAGTAYAAHLYRTRQILETERLRTRIATDLHDDIGSSLSRIAILTEVAAREVNGNTALSERLGRIGDVSREVIDSMSDIVWAVNPKNDSFADLASRMRRITSDLAGSTNVRLDFQATGETRDLRLGTGTRREVFLIFKEALNNALRHSQCRQAEVKLSLDGGWISLDVTDDGRGFAPEAVAAGNGLESMRARAKSMRGILSVESARGQGTRICLRVPAAGRRSGAWSRFLPQ